MCEVDRAVQQQVDNTGGVQIPKLTTFMGEQQVTACGHGPGTADPGEAGRYRREAIAPAIGGAIAGQDDHRAVRMDAIGVIRTAIADDDVSPCFDKQGA